MISDFKSINEPEMLDNARNGTIKQIQIIQRENKKYRLIVNLSWKDGDFVAVTMRKTPREWVSLDRLALHMQEHYGTIPKISLKFYKLEDKE